ncbi:hypothetical protein PGTUg99_032006 [Puccinia graminis f. sp. tritici]|uniref:Uncharacterized protein n=1 Tax=Puccinia graminis f. sp. tritici TaxID=56615 RepID=A0A5B0SLX5_PUCGR|nr:hypothetical protein PGTUg99_032006 [Puccinia graminis f. sp. tritici]
MQRWQLTYSSECSRFKNLVGTLFGRYFKICCIKMGFDNPENCDRKVWLNPAKSRGEAKYGLVLDGCAFVEEGETISEDDGCATVWVTRLLFEQLGGKKGEHNVTIRSWDFEAYDAPGN